MTEGGLTPGGRKREPLPKPDGAPFHCGAIVKVPKPLFYASCDALATCIVPEFKPSARCDAHQDVERFAE